MYRIIVALFIFSAIMRPPRGVIFKRINQPRTVPSTPYTISPLPPKVEALASQACRAVGWLHRCGLVSGDVTPYNFVLPGGNPDSIFGDSASSGRTEDWVKRQRRLRECSGCGGHNLRLVTARSVARRTDAAGGCPRHPLLQVLLWVARGGTFIAVLE